MSTVRRLSRDYAAQLAGFAVSFGDRLLVPGIFLRALGVPAFAAWSVAIAAASLISALDLGAVRYFTNRVIGLVEQGRSEDAREEFARGLLFLVAISLAAPVAIVWGASFGVFSSGDRILDSQLGALLVPICAAQAVRLLASLHLAIYRAHRGFATETLIVAASDAARIGVLLIAVLAGFDLVAAAWAWAVATFLLLAPVWVHLRRRFPLFETRLKRSSRSQLAEAALIGSGLWFASALSVAYVALPTIVLGQLVASAAALARFALIRTLANFVRQAMGMFGSVFGLELFRRQAAGDHGGFARVYLESGRLLAVQVGAGAGLLVAIGEPLFAYWTGRPELFNLPMLVLALAPLLCFPAIPLSVEALSYANRPLPLMQARLVQAGLSVVGFLVLVESDAALRMMAALAIGETLGLGLLLALAMRRLEPKIGIVPHLDFASRAWLTAAALFFLIGLLDAAPNTDPRLALALELAWGLAWAGVLVLVVGMSSGRRRRLMDGFLAALRQGR